MNLDVALLFAVVPWIGLGLLVLLKWTPLPGKATHLCVTLKHNEGVFIALRVERHWDRWVFEHGKTVPQIPGMDPQDIAGRIHVPCKNILYYQEMPNVVE